MCRFRTHAIIIVLTVFALSCSGRSGNPVTLGQPDLTAGQATADSDSTQLWGLWQVEFDPDTEEFHAVPLRGAEFACNVIKFVNGPPPSLIINLVSAFPYPTHMDFIVDVGFVHPFPGLTRYTGFDVMGVFMGNGTDFYPGDGFHRIAGVMDQQVLNPDGHTRRFNAPEFFGAGEILPLQGYYPGSNGPPGYVPTAVLNPYKYYADGIEPTDDAFEFLVSDPDVRGAFGPGNVNYRRFSIRFPNSVLMQFQYAVIANWDINDNHPDPPGSLDDFPLSCNSEEAPVVRIVDNSTAYYVDETSNGGEVNLILSVWDWTASGSTVTDEYDVMFYSDAWTGPATVIDDPVEFGDFYFTYNIEIEPLELTSSERLPIWMEVRYPEFDYTSPVGTPNDADGALASYFKFDIEVDDFAPNEPYIIVEIPNGGETWYTGSENSITWQSNGPIIEVKIDYSINGGLSYDYPIVASTPNDGVLDWTVPDNPTDMAKVRIQAVGMPGVEDESNENFTIAASSGEFVYVMADHQWITHINDFGCDNKIMWGNLLDLPLEGPFSDNTVVQMYQSRTSAPWVSSEFVSFINSLGYTYITVDDDTPQPVDTTGVKMLILYMLYPSDISEIYTPDEIQTLKEFVNGGGLLILLPDYTACHPVDAPVVNQLFDDLGLDLDYPNVTTYGDQWCNDITPDPVTVNVNAIKGSYIGECVVYGNGVSLARTGQGITVFCKAPIQ